MSSVELVLYPDPRLRDPAKAVTKIEPGLRGLCAEMFRVMYAARGIGLAGPQVGVGLRILVANLTGDPARTEEERVFLNPEIRSKSGELLEEEGCLSLPGIVAPVQRAERVEVRATGLDEAPLEVTAEGLYARLFQHEIDHLDGILLIDKISAADRRQWEPVLAELEKDFKLKRPRTRRRESRAAAL